MKYKKTIGHLSDDLIDQIVNDFDKIEITPDTSYSAFTFYSEFTAEEKEKFDFETVSPLWLLDIIRNKYIDEISDNMLDVTRTDLGKLETIQLADLFELNKILIAVKSDMAKILGKKFSD
jgi:hypothetical protein